MNVSVIRWALIGALALPLLAHAQIYKWVDDRGVTSYGNKPPPNAAGLTALTDGESRVSVIPSSRPQPATAARERDLESRIARGERERHALPSSVDRATVAAVERPLERRERCFAERRVDCTAPTAATYDITPSYSPFR
jgi:Domain of unknown function (DUF4124)